ncbi:hypothetical protein SO802_009943 [Lithocarpus litseifolius]|uniref:Uncharacterized protein n=1 Tax=Lithocarpus litseifolius TaxID=425828 RepID=A0AAW2DDG5_9ROSI
MNNFFFSPKPTRLLNSEQSLPDPYAPAPILDTSAALPLQSATLALPLPFSADLSLKIDPFQFHRLVWKENQPKLFTVISIYQVALRLKHQARIEDSGVRAHLIVWKNVWAFRLTGGILKACN